MEESIADHRRDAHGRVNSRPSRLRQQVPRVTLEATYTSVSDGWAKVERWFDSNSGYNAAQYPADGRLDQTGQRKTFFNGVARPVAGRYLLSYAPGWNTNSKATPVLLVPGA